MGRNRRSWINPALAMLFFIAAAAVLPASEGRINADSFHASAPPDGAREAWRATVLLETRTWQSGSRAPSVATGSGLIIDHVETSRTIWIVTSSHVIRCSAACLTRAYLPARSGKGQVATSVELAWRDPGRDLALLRATVPRKAAAPVARLATSVPSPELFQIDVLAIGYPDLTILSEEPGALVRPRRRFSTGRLLAASAHLKAEYIPYGSARAEGRLDLDDALIHDANLLPGSSGGPLIDSGGRILGINTGSLTVSGTRSCADRRERCRLHLAVAIDDLLEIARTLEAAR